MGRSVSRARKADWGNCFFRECPPNTQQTGISAGITPGLTIQLIVQPPYSPEFAPVGRSGFTRASAIIGAWNRLEAERGHIRPRCAYAWTEEGVLRGSAVLSTLLEALQFCQ